MTRVSKYYVERQVLSEINQAFGWLISKVNSEKMVELFVDDFFTDEERLMFAKRLFVGYLVAKGLDYQEVVGILKVSPATVRQTKEWLKRRAGYREIIRMLVKRQKEIEFDKKLEKIARRIWPQSKRDWSRLAGTSDFPD